MNTECQMLANCGFFKKYCQTKDLACRGFIAMYCKGEKMDDCKRRIHRQTHGTPPPDDMMPNGMMISGKL